MAIHNKGKLIYKFKRPWKNKNLIIYSVVDIFCILACGFMLYFLILVLVYGQFPVSLFPIISISFGIFTGGFASYCLTVLIIQKFSRHLVIYENGVEIRFFSMIPLKNQREFISYGEITDIETKKHNNEPYIMFIHMEGRDAYELGKSDVAELQETADLILKSKEEKK